MTITHNQKNAAAEQPNAECAVLSYDGYGGIYVQPTVVSIDDFLPARFTANVNCGGQIAVERQPESLGASAQRPCLGLEPVVSLELRRRGFHVDRRVRPVQDLGAVAGNGDTRPAVFVKNNPLGLIEFGASVDRNALLSDLVRLLPEARFAFATAGKARAKQLHDHFRKINIASTLASTKPPSDSDSRRIVVGTFSALASAEVECNKRAVFVVVNAPDAMHAGAAACLTQADFGCRLLGVVSTEKCLSAGERDRLATVFGFERLTIPAPGLELSSPVVVPWKYQGGGIANGAKPHEVILRLWRDHQRNRTIAKVARLIITGTDASVSDRLGSPPQLSDQVILLAGSVEQAARVGTLLADWPIRTAEAHLNELSGRPRRSLARGRTRWAAGRHWITTPQAADDIELPFDRGLTVVVWAGAGPGLPPLPAQWLTVPARSGRKLLIVDIEDRHHPTLRRWSRSRQRAYREAEWLRPGESIVNHRVESFLKRRREERNG